LTALSGGASVAAQCTVLAAADADLTLIDVLTICIAMCFAVSVGISIAKSCTAFSIMFATMATRSGVSILDDSGQLRRLTDYLNSPTYGGPSLLLGCNPSAKRKLPLARSDERPTLRKKSTAAATRVAGTSMLRWLGEYD
jgi:hypothetical protein